MVSAEGTEEDSSALEWIAGFKLVGGLFRTLRDKRRVITPRSDVEEPNGSIN